MKTSTTWWGRLARAFAALMLASSVFAADEDLEQLSRGTTVTIVGDEFYLNGRPTYEARQWRDMKIQGLLLNARMVQGIFDDANPDTVQKWAYPDTGRWDPERNTQEFLAAMPEWRRHGLLAFSLNLQGGNPVRNATEQPWRNSAFGPDGSLRPDYMARLERILNQANELGMAVLLGYFYFGQDHVLKDEAAVIAATDNITRWLLARNYRHVLVEINNECNINYDHPILRPERVHELILRVRDTTIQHRRLYVGTSYGGGTVPGDNVARVSDFLLMHGNGVDDPARIAEMVRQARALNRMFPKPILFTEDDHYRFDQPTNNFTAALSQYASWGYFDGGTNNYQDGYQSPPVNWGISSQRKHAFFSLLAEITGSETPAEWSMLGIRMPGLQASTPRVSVTAIDYHGWTNAFRLRNAQAEVIIVPAIGRIMQFGYIGQEGVFWENRTLDGKYPDTNAPAWINYGGDKTWPAPESQWGKYTGRKEWRPPPAFDGMPASTRLEGNGDLILTTPVDPYYGIRAHRRIHLEPDQPVMTITTTYERVAPGDIQIGVWVITQLKDPVRLFAPVGTSRRAQAFVTLSSQPPPGLEVRKGLVSLARNPNAAHKIGLASDTLVWMGIKHGLRIDSLRQVGADYPDQGSSAEIYTSPDPLPYIELEMLGPLQGLSRGDRIDQVSTYTLFPRKDANPEAEARKLLSL